MLYTARLGDGEQRYRAFTLSPAFTRQFEGQQPKWGPIGYFVYKRTYARRLPDGTYEEFWQTLKRVVEGTFNIQKIHIKNQRQPWDNAKAQASAQEMFQRMWDFKFLPPGRGLRCMGTDLVYEKGSACLNNCGFTSTENIDVNFADPFCFLMDMSMLGVGVGGDTKGAGKVRIRVPDYTDEPFIVADTREGWVALIRRILNAFVGVETMPQSIDYSLIRPKGTPVKGVGGTASGPGPLIELANDLITLLMPKGNGAAEPYAITSTIIVDIFNFIGKCVVSGGIRRTAEIMFGDPLDREFQNLKNSSSLTKLYEAKTRTEALLEEASAGQQGFLFSDLDRLDKEIKSHPLNDRRWASNNSNLCRVGMDYTEMADRNADNGEPGGIWLDNIRTYSRMSDPPDNKDYKAAGCNPCGEQSLESFELCCVTGNTRILTSQGSPYIAEVVGKEVEVWNGEDWSVVTPFEAGKAKDIYRVHLSDGSYLDCTDDHKWEVLPPNKRKYRQVETQDLVVGSKVTEFNVTSPIQGEPLPHAYEWGFFTGDGFIDNAQVMIGLYGTEKNRLADKLAGVAYKEQHPEGYADPFCRMNLTQVFREDHPDSFFDKARALNNKFGGLPGWVFNLDKTSTLKFIAGWLDADGSLTKQTNTDNYRVFGTEPAMRDLQMLMRRVGIDHASVYLMAEAGEELVINGRIATRNHDLWVCYVPSYETEALSHHCLLKVATRFGSRYAANNAHPNGAPIDRARKQKIVDVEILPGKHTTYCFTEPVRHMGVFGNVLTYQCLVETFPNNCEDLDDFLRTLKYAYLYAKTVTLVPTHDYRTNQVMMWNRRIGTSQSGIQQAITRLGRRKHIEWCDSGYNYIMDLDKIYSKWLCIPESIKKTSVKPSGTVSLLCGATAGIHHEEWKYIIRNVRISEDSPFLQACIDAGYPVEPALREKHTFVVSFPVKVEGISKSKPEVSIWEQFADAVAMQKWWSDNQVSVTVSFSTENAVLTEKDGELVWVGVEDLTGVETFARNHEGKPLFIRDERGEVKSCLEVFEDQLKSISFLPYNTHGYPQAPLIPITEARYNQLVANLTPLDLSNARHEVDDEYCSGVKCLL